MNSKSFTSPLNDYDKKKWYLTLTNISLLWKTDEETIAFPLEAIGTFLISEFKNQGVDIHVSECDEENTISSQILAVGWEFPVALLKSLFVWECRRKLSVWYSERDPEFIVGNYYAAFTNNPQLKYYVPTLKQGYKSIEEIMDEVPGDLSKCRILYMQNIDLDNLPDSVESSNIWSPYHLTLNKNEIKERFSALISRRQEIKNAYIRKLLEIISKVSFDRKVICYDTSGLLHLINTSKILQIIPNNEDNENLCSAILLENNSRIDVDLKVFTKEFAGFIPKGSFSLPISLINFYNESFPILTLKEDAFYENIWENVKKRFNEWNDSCDFWVVEPKFVIACDFHNGLACVRLGGKWGYIDRSGAWAFEPRFNSACDFHDGLACVRLDGKEGYIDRSGKWAFEPKFDRACDFHDGLARVSLGGKWGYIDRSGAWVVKPRFDDACDFHDGLACVSLGGNKWGYIGKFGPFVIMP